MNGVVYLEQMATTKTLEHSYKIELSLGVGQIRRKKSDQKRHPMLTHPKTAGNRPPPAARRQPLITLSGVNKSYATPSGSFHALQDISLEVGQGEAAWFKSSISSIKNPPNSRGVFYLPLQHAIQNTIQILCARAKQQFNHPLEFYSPRGFKQNHIACL